MKISGKNGIQFLKVLKPFVTFQQEKTVVFCVMKISEKKTEFNFLKVLKPFVTFQQEKNCGFLCHENKRKKTEFFNNPTRIIFKILYLVICISSVRHPKIYFMHTCDNWIIISEFIFMLCDPVFS